MYHVGAQGIDERMINVHYYYYYYIHYYCYVLNWPGRICNVCLVPWTPRAVDGTLIVDCTCIAPVPVYTPPPTTLPHHISHATAHKYTHKNCVIVFESDFD